MVLGPEWILVAIGLALFFDFWNGVNDAANSIATIIATRVLRPFQAVALAACFNFLGPFALGTAVAATVGKGIVDPSVITTQLIMAAAIGGTAWTWFATQYGIPISVSHSLIGGVIGGGLAAAGTDSLILPAWQGIQPVFLVMRDGAVAGAGLAVLGMLLARGRNYPLGLALGAFVGSGVWLAANIFMEAVTVKGLFAVILFIFYSPMLGFFLAYVFNVAILWTFRRATPTRMRFWFGIFQIGSASFYSLGHGTNDAQKTMGIIWALLIANQWIGPEAPLPVWVILASATAIALGTFIGGYKVVRTMGFRLTHLEPYQGFAAETSSAIGLFFLAHFGVPVSTTHSITGSILGVGAVRGAHNVRWDVARTIVGAWLLTIPAATAVSFAVFHLIRVILG